MIRIIWPEDKFVSDEQIAQWYADAVANGDIAPPVVTNAHEMALALDDAGIITLANNTL